MRVLFLTHPEADFGEFYFYNGLCEVLGDENVVDVPFKLSYHGQIHHYAGYPTGYAQGSSQQWGLAGTGGQGCTAPFPYAPARAGREWSHEEVLDTLSKDGFDLVIVSHRYEGLRHLDVLRPAIKSGRIVMYDGDDFDDVDFYGSAARHGVRLYLKRELVPAWASRPWPFTLRPFPFSSMSSVETRCDKTLDVLCAVGASNPVRAVAQEIVGSLNARVEVGYWGWSRYLELIALSRIAVAPRGHGRDTARRWEIPQFDTLLLCEKLDLIEDNPLRDGEHCSYYVGPEQLGQKLRWWLAHPDETHSVALAGQAFVREHHTNAARARRMIEWSREVYG